MPQQLDEKFSELHDRINKTCKARFQADRRYRSHAAWSLWTVALTSILLILINLLDSFKLIGYFSDSQISVIQILASVFILAYSLILTMRGYAVDAVKMHRCGLELSDLLFEVHPYVEQVGSDDDYHRLKQRYSAILAQYQNHEDIDHLVMKTKNKKCYTLKWHEKLNITFLHWMGFSHYVIVMLVEIGLTISLLLNQTPTP